MYALKKEKKRKRTRSMRQIPIEDLLVLEASILILQPEQVIKAPNPLPAKTASGTFTAAYEGLTEV
jgi:hypothetical protein